MSHPVEPQPIAARRRSMVALFAGVVLMTVATVAASTMGTLVASTVAGPGWSGVPNAAGVLGTAIGTTCLSAVISRVGRRIGLVLGYVAAGAGAVLAAFGGALPSMWLLVPGMTLLGIGNGGAQLGRYLASDLYPPARRGFALGLIVWGGTVGALVGPGMIAVSNTAAGQAGFAPAAGPYLLALLAAVLAVAAAWALLGRGRRGATRRQAGQGERVSVLLRLPVVTIALTSMITAQIAMVAVMTMTPLQMQMSDEGLGMVGAILTVHMIGMFALAPLSGLLANRFGGLRTVFGGLATLAVACLSVALAPGVASGISYGALFLLGYGWNLTFVGASSLLATGLPEASRTRLQGAVDGLAWTASALASIGAGLMVAASGYAVLAAVVAAALVVPTALVVRTTRRLVVPTGTV